MGVEIPPIEVLPEALVVASNAPTAVITQAKKAQPIYGNLVGVCDGVADNLEIQAAIAAVP